MRVTPHSKEFIIVINGFLEDERNGLEHKIHTGLIVGTIQN